MTEKNGKFGYKCCRGNGRRWREGFSPKRPIKKYRSCYHWDKSPAFLLKGIFCFFLFRLHIVRFKKWWKNGWAVGWEWRGLRNKQANKGWNGKTKGASLLSLYWKGCRVEEVLVWWVKCVGPEGQIENFRPYVADMLINLWGRYLLQHLVLRLIFLQLPRQHITK